MRSWTKAVCAVALVGALAAVADATQGRFRGRRTRLKAAMTVRQPQEDPQAKRAKKVAVIKARPVVEDALLDGTPGASYTFDLTLEPSTQAFLAGSLDLKNDRKAKVVAGEDDRAAVQAIWDAYVSARNPRGKPNLDAVPVIFTSATAKGIYKVSGDFQQARFKVTYLVNGVVDGGQFDGFPVDGRLTLTMSGSRDFE